MGHTCIERKLICDGTIDYPGGSDEDVSRCGGELTKCGFSGNGNNQLHFAGRPTDPPCNLTTEFDCKVPPPSPHNCIPQFWVCDGKTDCDSGVDEDAVQVLVFTDRQMIYFNCLP